MSIILSMDSFVILGIGLIVASIIVGASGITVAFLYSQTTIYRQGQLNYRAALKAQTDLQKGVVPHEGSDGGILQELMPIVEILSRPDMKPLVEKFLSGQQMNKPNTGELTNGEKVQ